MSYEAEYPPASDERKDTFDPSGDDISEQLQRIVVEADIHISGPVSLCRLL